MTPDVKTEKEDQNVLGAAKSCMKTILDVS
jgi:hypothetical protein